MANRRLLLDSHAFLWAITEPERLGARIRNLLLDPETEAWVSVASIWELLLKQAKGKLQIDVDLSDIMRDMEAARLRMLAIRHEHVVAAYALPGIHKGPFDRLLIAQAHNEGLLFATRDGTVRKYGVETVWN